MRNINVCATGNTLLSPCHQPFETQQMPTRSVVGGSRERNIVFGSTTNFEFAVEAEKMVSELCSSTSKRDSVPEHAEHRRAAVCLSDTSVRQIAPTPEREMCFRDLVVKGCLELENILRAHKRNMYIGDLLSFCRTIRESANNREGFDLDKPCDETRGRIIAFFRLASCWLGVYPCLESSLGPGPGPGPLHAAFREWQTASRRLIVATLQSVPLLGAQAAAQSKSTPHSKQNKFAEPGKTSDFKIWNSRNTVNHFQDANSCHKWTISPEASEKQNSFQNEYNLASNTSLKISTPRKYSAPDNWSSSDCGKRSRAATPASPFCDAGRANSTTVFGEDSKIQNWKTHRSDKWKVQRENPSLAHKEAPKFSLAPGNERSSAVEVNKILHSYNHVSADSLSSGTCPSVYTPETKGSANRHQNLPSPPPRFSCHDTRQSNNHTPSKGRQWYRYNSREKRHGIAPSLASYSVYDGDSSDDLQDGAYMKPGSYEVPKRQTGAGSTSQDNAWRAALASAETLCKALETDQWLAGLAHFAQCQPQTHMNGSDLDAAHESTPISFEATKENGDIDVKDIVASLDTHVVKTPRLQVGLGLPVRVEENSAAVNQKTDKRTKSRARAGARSARTLGRTGRSRSRSVSLSPMAIGALQAPVQSSLSVPVQASTLTPPQTSLQPLLQLQAPGPLECPLQTSLQTILDAVWSLEEARCVKYTRSECGEMNQVSFQGANCLSSMAQKLMSSGYDTVDQFVDDFRTVLQARVTTRNAGAVKVLEEKFYQLLDLTLKNGYFSKDPIDENSSILTSAASSEAELTETESLISRPRE